MVALSLYTPTEVCIRLATRVRDLRLRHGWTQSELAARSGVALATLRLFERTGRVSLDRLLRVASALGRLDDFADVLNPPVGDTLEEIEAMSAPPKRRHGRSTRRRTPTSTAKPRGSV